jgi:hypothetical protein
VCVLGESAKVNLLGYDPAVGKYVKINDVWLQVIGVLSQQASGDTEIEGVEVVNRNNLVIAPLNTVMRRFEGQQQLPERRDRRHLHPREAGCRLHRNRERRQRHPDRDP